MVVEVVGVVVPQVDDRVERGLLLCCFTIVVTS